MPQRSLGVDPELSLAWLLAPLTVETFLDRDMGAESLPRQPKRLRIFRRPAGRVRPPLTICWGSFGRICHWLAWSGRTTKKSHTSTGVADGGFDAAAIGRDFADGYTIVLESVQRYVRAIASLPHSIEVELNFATQVNAYFTPPESQGFVPHYDEHDVLILQIQGSKIWHFYDGADVAPHEMRRHEPVAADALPAPTDVRLEAGDVLYLPRGRVHAAEATSEVSVHLTVGFNAPTLFMLVTRALNALSHSDDRVHTQLPPRYLDDPDVRAALGALVRDVAEALEQPNAIAEGLESLEDDLVRRGQARRSGRRSRTPSRSTDQTRVVKYQPLYSRVTETPDGVALHFAQLVVNAGPDHKDALQFLAKSTEPFRVCDLPGLV